MKQTKWLVIALIVLLSVPTISQAFDRRKEQFHTESSYLIFPLPYSIPGIGEGIMGLGLAGNFLDWYADIYALAITGDAGGQIIGIDDIHIWPKTVFIDLFYQNITKAVVNNYEKRGMDTEKDNYNLIELDEVYSTDARITLSLFDRRFEIYGSQYFQAISVPRIRDSKGEIIRDFEEPYEAEARQTAIGMELDITDDKQDPLKGFRINVGRNSSPPKEDYDPDFFTLNKSASFFVPLGEYSTIAFNYFAADSIVIKKGNTDPALAKAQLNMNCPTGNLVCEKAEQDLINSFIAGRKYGTAGGLGGQNMLRAYPQGRFQGAHLLYYSAELRYNFSSEVTPFDFWIWQDTSTGIQLALFHEVGAAEDFVEDLAGSTRTSSGLGIRMISASGYVYRFDIASGDEGSNTTIIFDYPW